MWDVEHLRGEIEALKVEKRRLWEVIQRLDENILAKPGSHRAISAMPEERELEERKTELKSVEKQIREKEALTVYKTLIMLDYTSQINFFQTHNMNHYVGAFMLHSSEENALEYKGRSILALLKRLVSATPNNPVTPFIEHELPFRGQRTDIRALWRHLAVQVVLENDAEQEEIIKNVCEILMHRNVILVFRGVNHMPPEFLKSLIKKFWEPLATAALATMEHVQRDKRHRLLMFLVDYVGHRIDWDIPCMEELGSKAWTPDIPIRLCIVTKLSEMELREWLNRWNEYLFHILPPHLKHHPFEFGVQQILANSDNGDPDQVMCYICEQCNYLIEGIDECLKL